jgi:hypothetical protein
VLFLFVLQENEQIRRKAQAGNVVPFNEESFILSE